MPRFINISPYFATVIAASVACLLMMTVIPVARAYAAAEAMKTSRVRVGEAAPLEGQVRTAHEDGKAVVLLLLPNPIQCNGCDVLAEAIGAEVERRSGDVAYITKGGLDMRGAVEEETVALKRLYGFVTVGEPFTFVIDREGILRKILIGRMTADEMGAMLDDVLGGSK
jgi:hypothetical protein